VFIVIQKPNSNKVFLSYSSYLILRQRYGNGHLEIRKMKIKETNLFNTVGCCIYKKQLLNS
jgi:hypothetical protein